MTKNIVLCGFMGSGKTTLGKLLAARLEAPFIDVDDYIVAEQGADIPELFRVHGEEGFRQMEHEAVLALGSKGGAVIATGGGALTFARNVPPLKANGVILYLNPGFDECYLRIQASDRPLVRANTREQLAALYIAREECYRAVADAEVAVLGTAAECVEKVLAVIGDRLV